MTSLLPVKQGISSPAVLSIPDKWDQQWFRYFIDYFLVGADIRNVTPGQGITISGNVSGNSTTGSASSTVTISQSPIPNDTVQGNVSGASAIPSPINSTQLTTLINAFTASLSGAVPASGGGTVNFLRADGTWVPLAGANPTAKVGPTVVNGSATTFMRSDAAPPIDLTAAYAWTGSHTFSIPIPVLSGGSGTSTPSLVAGTNITVTGSWPNQTINGAATVSGANPTAKVGPTATNGSATTYLRSDGAPAIDLTASYTWTAGHVFAPSATNVVGVTVTAPTSGTVAAILVNGNNTSTPMSIASGFSAGTAGTEFNIRRAGSNANTILNGASIDLSDSSATTSSVIQHSGGQFELWMTQNNGVTWTQALKILQTNGFVINTPTSGDALLVSGSSHHTGAAAFDAQIFTSKGGTVLASGTAGTLVTLPNTTGFATYLISAGLNNVNDAANYSAVSLVCVNGTAAKITALQTAGLVTITLSGLNVQGTQSSGALQTIIYSIIRVA